MIAVVCCWFPGDLERRGEALLLSRMASTDADAAPLLPATVLIAPHHGSQTSSTAAFIEALQPQHVVFTAGYQNRLGFPHAEVRARYDRMGSETYTTGEDGAISFYLSELGLKQAPTRFWQTPPEGARIRYKIVCLVTTRFKGNNTVWEIVTAGGWLMLPIIACSIIALAIIAERFYTLRENKVAVKLRMS